MTDLRDRGVDAAGGSLFGLDGGKALRRAVQDVFGEQALVQRCRIHQERGGPRPPAGANCRNSPGHWPK